MDEYPISRLYRDQKVLEIGEGTNEIQRLVIAREFGLLVWGHPEPPPAFERTVSSRAHGTPNVPRGGRASVAFPLVFQPGSCSIETSHRRR